MLSLSAKELLLPLKAHGARSLLILGEGAAALRSQFAALHGEDFETFGPGGAGLTNPPLTPAQGYLLQNADLQRDFDAILCLDALTQVPHALLAGELRTLKSHAKMLCYFTVGLSLGGEDAATGDDGPHQTVRTAQWWLNQFQKAGFSPLDNRVVRDAAGKDQLLHVFLAPPDAERPMEFRTDADSAAKSTVEILPQAAHEAAAVKTAAPRLATAKVCKTSPDGVLNAAMGLHRQGRSSEAAPLYQEVLKVRPGNSDALHGLGMIALDSGKLPDAERLIRKAIEADAGKASYHSNLGHLLALDGRPGEAFKAYARAIELAPDVAVAYSNLGNALRDSGRVDEAQEAFRRAIALEPGMATARASLAQLKLLIGNYSEGWNELRWCFESGVRKWYGLPLPEWDGSALAEGGLVLWGDWGIGDQLMVLRLLSRLPDLVERTVCICDQRLMPLLARSFPEIIFQAPMDPLQLRSRFPEVTLQLPICDLARVLCPDPAALGGGAAFLRPNAARVTELKARYGDDKPLIGIAWRGGSFAETKALRSVPLAQWGPILGLRDMTFISLQNGDHGAEIAEVSEAMGVEIRVDTQVDQMRDLDTLAAQIAAMDRVVSVDCTGVHLAGTLGVATDVLLPLVPDWRWGLKGETTPWYDSLTLHRQVRARDWDKPVANARRALQAALKV